MRAAFAKESGSLRLFVLAIFAVIVLGSAFSESKPVSGAGSDPWQTAASRPFERDLQKPLSAQSKDWKISLTGRIQCQPDVAALWCYNFSSENRATRKIVNFRLGNETSQIDAVTIVNQSRVAVLGRTPDLSVVTIFELPSGKIVDKIICSGASISPDNRYFAYGKFVPAHPGYEWSPNAEYLVYDLTASPTENRTPENRDRLPEAYDAGWPLYPEGLKNLPGDNLLEGHDLPVHWMVSLFYWFGKADTLTFVDRWKGAASLVLADISAGVGHPKISVYALNLTGVIDLPGCRAKVASSDMESWSNDSSTLIDVKAIEISPRRRDVLRLHLAPHPCLRADELDVPLGSRLDD